MLYIASQVSFTLFRIAVNSDSLLPTFLILQKAFHFSLFRSRWFVMDKHSFHENKGADNLLEFSLGQTKQKKQPAHILSLSCIC